MLYPALDARLGGPTTAGVNELAVDTDRDDAAGDLKERTVLAGLLTVGDGDWAMMDDCSLEVLIGVLGRGLCITGGEETWVISGVGIEEPVASCVGEIGSKGTKVLD